jgi:hypothetical protein
VQKAQSFAMKQYLTFTFFIPVEGMEGDEDHEKIPGRPRPTPVMTPSQPGGAPPPDYTQRIVELYKQRIVELMEQRGLSDEAIDSWIARTKAKYGADLARHLPGIYERMLAKAAPATAPVAVADDTLPPW